LGVEVPDPVRRISFDEAMDKYGVDNPDLRFGMELVELTDIFRGGKFRAFAEVIDEGGIVKSLNVKEGGTLSRKQLDDLGKVATTYGAKGLAWIKVNPDGWQGPLAKFIGEDDRARITQALSLEPGDLFLMVGDEPDTANAAMGNLRKHLGRMLSLIDENAWEFVWITDFLAFEWDAEEGRWGARHHPFTSPKPSELELLDTDPGRVHAQAYDLVLNGNEIAGGSVRIHDTELQQRIFRLLGIGPEEAEHKFGFLLKALRYGAPPHGGIAFGFDRLAMLMSGAQSLRDVIAFPKTQRASCLMTEAPSTVDTAQLEELGLRIVVPT
jgi:aspartyl-tRNA synthetase